MKVILQILLQQSLVVVTGEGLARGLSTWGVRFRAWNLGLKAKALLSRFGFGDLWL